MIRDHHGTMHHASWPLRPLRLRLRPSLPLLLAAGSLCQLKASPGEGSACNARGQRVQRARSSVCNTRSACSSQAAMPAPGPPQDAARPVGPEVGRAHPSVSSCHAHPSPGHSDSHIDSVDCRLSGSSRKYNKTLNEGDSALCGQADPGPGQGSAHWLMGHQLMGSKFCSFKFQVSENY